MPIAPIVLGGALLGLLVLPIATLVLTSSPADRLVGACCCALALAVPPLELLPFATFIPMAAIAVFGLSLVARDGVLVLGGLLLTCALVALVAFQLLG